MVQIASIPGWQTPGDTPGESRYSPASLREKAKAAPVGWEVVYWPHGHGAFTQRIITARESLEQFHERLLAKPRNGEGTSDLPEPLPELRQNPGTMRAAVVDAFCIRKTLSRMPRLIRAREGDEPRIVAVADAYLRATGSVWDEDAFKIFLDQLQRQDPLQLQEIRAFPIILKFLLTEEIIARAEELMDHPQAHTPAAVDALKVRIKSLREAGYTEWLLLVEPLIVFDYLLHQDPAGAFALMDQDTRDEYRQRVADIAYDAGCSETQAAEAALALAKEAMLRPKGTDPRRQQRRSHIGYYLIDRGYNLLASRLGARPHWPERIRRAVQRNADDFYIGGIQVITVLLIGLILLPLAPNYPIFGGLTWAFLLLLLPATQGAVDLVNNTVVAIFKPRLLSKLDFSQGVPAEFTTLVVVPTLLLNPAQVRDLFEQLEVRYLANQDRNIHFGLLTDLADSITRPRPNDSDPLLELAIRLTEDLNRRYAEAGSGSFFLLHRHRVFNPRQGVWMGWERKRGKLLDLNKLLKGQYDPFPVKAGNLQALAHARYVITLDSDTQLPRDSARQLIGTMAHPLNRAVIDPASRIVTEGYGILQPRVGVSVHSASRSRLAAIYSGQTGFDIYARAISDVYQDLYGEGIFTGKGIYEIDVFHAVLDHRFPRNALLSHDLIEGSYARVGLATDIEVIDDYPSHYSAYNRRKHRWVRGDWQIGQWLLSKVPDESGRYVPNPIATISRWKIFDNLRRSLVETFTFVLLIAGWLGLPGGPLYWTLATLFLIFSPTLVQLAFGLGHAVHTRSQIAFRETFGYFWQGLFICLLNLAFLPHQTLLAMDAIIRSLVRSFITGRRLLEWETAAESESRDRRSTPVDRYLAFTPLVAFLVGVVVLIRRPSSLLVALPILILWGLAGGITAWLNQAPRETRPNLDDREIAFLHEMALRTWRYFYQFGGGNHNYLIPDNVEEEGLVEASRVSPTNLGLLLNARQAALTLGYLTLPEFASLTASSLESFDRLEKYRGHLYNWYDTQTLEPLPPRVVSSVDSGNLAASLYTLRAGCQAVLHCPVLDRALFRGLCDHWELLLSLGRKPAELKNMAPPSSEAAAGEWIAWALAAAEAPVFAQELPNGSNAGEYSWWLNETHTRIEALVALVRESLPWLLPEFAPLFALPQLQGIAVSAEVVLVRDAANFAGDLDARLSRASVALAAESPEVLLAEKLRTALHPAQQRLRALTLSLEKLTTESMRIATEMDFGLLVNRKRLLLSIGYDVERKQNHPACYDLLASEGRIAAFIAIAKGDVPQRSWFRLGRAHTLAYGRAVLASWTGTMFEYLMPALWMRSYPDTLVSRSLRAVISVQRSYALARGIPWGISESGFADKDEHGHYGYEAFGIPWVAVKWNASAGPVVSPYSTFLALEFAPAESMRNLKRMAKLGWIGAYGFYEAADYRKPGSPQLVREWMAHHQGMSLLAVLNLLNDNAVQRWFHANPHLRATQPLLHEKPVRESTLRDRYRASQPRALRKHRRQREALISK
ncbi:MAG TPA: glucoamylase family protein [Acidobacteriaceae bacterium]|nr:glucoamylase family protein [Acidobacteriaceae bacterium]